MNKLLAYVQLVRLPNVFTAIADIMMGFFVALGVIEPRLFLLVAASCSLYCAGMVLNDVMDLDVDNRERPDRPLPSGRIDPEWAKRLGFGMLGLGVAIATSLGPTSGGIAMTLAVAIYLYDGPLKRTVFAPWVMGSCRTLNVLLGMSMAPTLLQPDHLFIAGGLGIYVTGITWFARCESKTSDRRLLIFGFALMLSGIAAIAWFPSFAGKRFSILLSIPWPALFAWLMLPVLNRCVAAIWDPKPSRVQRAVRTSLRSLIVMDAAVVLGTSEPRYAIAVVLLLVPSVLLGRWVYST